MANTKILLSQADLAERFHQHLRQEGDCNSLSPQYHGPLEPQMAPQAQELEPRSSHGLDSHQLATMAITLLAQLATSPAPARDPLQRARGLAEAAEAQLVLTSKELAAVVGHGIGSWKHGREDYGFLFRRHKQQGRVLWTVERAPLPHHHDSENHPANLPQTADGPFLGRMGHYRA